MTNAAAILRSGRIATGYTQLSDDKLTAPSDTHPVPDARTLSPPPTPFYGVRCSIGKITRGLPSS